MRRNKSLITRFGVFLLTFNLLFGTFTQSFIIRAVNTEETPKSETIFLSDLEWQSATIDWNEKPNRDASTNGSTLTLTNNYNQPISFEKGIGTHANSEIIYDLSNLDYNYLTTWVGVNQEVPNGRGSVIFEIYADEELKYESKVMNSSTPMEYTTIDISGADTLKLVVDDAGDGIGNDHGNWADTQLHTENPIERNIEVIEEYEGMKLIFNEEFEGDELNNELWSTLPWPENGTHHYANTFGKDENIWVEDGNLIIQAKPYEGDENHYNTTSGHIVTHGNFDFRYGRVDVRAKIPTETGMWPAIWMMPSIQNYSWPMEGEIDIMELISQEPNKLYSTVHSGISGPNYRDYYFNQGGTFTIDQGTFFDDYHVYSLEWEPGVMRFFVDDFLIEEMTDWKNWYLDDSGVIVERDFPAPFDQEFHIKLNLATGGNWAIDVDETTRYGERTSMKVDYVRVYQEETPDYNYSEDDPFINENQGAVWYAQKGHNGTWENYQQFDSNSSTWFSSDSGIIDDNNDSAYVSLNKISANFDSDSIYDTTSISFRAPYTGFVKASLKDEVDLDNPSQVTFNLTKGNMKTTKSEIIRSETITNETNDLTTTKTYLPIEADEIIRFEILKSDNEIDHFDPVIEYITEEEYYAYTNLTNEIQAFENIDTSGYTRSSAEKFENTLDDAKNLLNGTGNVEAYINTLTKLTEAFNNLDELDITPPSDKSVLEHLIKQAEVMNTANKTDESVVILEQAIGNAKAVLNDEDASQEAVDQQIDALNAAIDGLITQPLPSVDKSLLEHLINQTEAMDTANKTDKSVVILEQAIGNAKAVLNDEDASQEAVDQQIDALNAAIDGLITQPLPSVDRSVLVEKLDQAKNINTNHKTSESVKNLENAIAVAELLLTNEAATQNQINQSLVALIDAMNDLKTIRVSDDKDLTDPNDESTVTNIGNDNQEALPKTATQLYTVLILGVLLVGLGSIVLIKRNN